MSMKTAITFAHFWKSRKIGEEAILEVLGSTITQSIKERWESIHFELFYNIPAMGCNENAATWLAADGPSAKDEV